MSKKSGSIWLRYLGCFLAGIAVALGTRFFLESRAHEPARKRVGGTLVAAQPPGNQPWGTLDALRIPLANPDEIFVDRPARLRPARWVFQGLSREQLGAALRDAGLNQGMQRELLAGAQQDGTNGWMLLPSNKLVRELTPSSRASLYSLLSRSSANYTQCYPFRFAFKTFEERLAEADFDEQTSNAFGSLLYTNAGTVCFADLQALPEILKPQQVNEVEEFVYRLPTYRLRLRIYTNSDIGALVKYWGTGGQEKKMRPLLESLTYVRRTNGTSINIGSMMPPFARFRLNTFPSAWEEAEAREEDCFWTSMNFFHEKPDMRYLDPENVRKALQEEYTIVRGQPEFGDLVTIINERGDAVHMCVYIAEDFVFTKNGKNPLQPWVIMKIRDMLVSFATEHGPKMVIFRQKAQPLTKSP